MANDDKMTVKLSHKTLPDTRLCLGASVYHRKWDSYDFSSDGI